jgi:hypothetical protein
MRRHAPASPRNGAWESCNDVVAVLVAVGVLFENAEFACSSNRRACANAWRVDQIVAAFRIGWAVLVPSRVAIFVAILRFFPLCPNRDKDSRCYQHA